MIIRDGLIYVVDIRNGLYVLRYAGPHGRGRRDPLPRGQLDLGDALRLDKSAG